MMTGSETASMRSERRIALQDLGEEIKNLKPQLDEFDLRKLNIRVQKIDLDGKPDFEPSFFQPYQGPLLPPDEAAMEREWLSYEEESESEEFPSNPVDRALGLSIYFRDYLSFCRMIVSEQGQRHGLWSYKECVSSPSVYWFAMILLLTMRDSMRDYRFKGILYADSDISWRLIKVYYIQGREYPHLNCMMLYDASKENRLLRGELQAIITMMIQHLRSKRFTDHIVAPVS